MWKETRPLEPLSAGRGSHMLRYFGAFGESRDGVRSDLYVRDTMGALAVRGAVVTLNDVVPLMRCIMWKAFG